MTRPMYPSPSPCLCLIMFRKHTVLGECLQTAGVAGILCESSVHVCGYFWFHRAVGEALQKGHSRVGYLGSGKSQMHRHPELRERQLLQSECGRGTPWRMFITTYPEKETLCYNSGRVFVFLF